MPLVSSAALCLSWAAATAAHDASGSACEPRRPNCQLPEQVLRYLPPRQIPGPIASGTRGAVTGRNLSGFTGASGEAREARGKQEVRQMSERTPHSRFLMKGNVLQPYSYVSECPTGRLACAGSEVAA